MGDEADEEKPLGTAAAAASADGGVFGASADGAVFGSQSASGSRMPPLKLRTLNKELARDPGGYKEWRKELDILKAVYQVDERDLGPLVYLALQAGEGEPRGLVESLELPDLRHEKGLQNLLAILDEEFIKPTYEVADKYVTIYEQCRRRAGEPMEDYLTRLTVARRNAQKEDPGTSYSELATARKMLRCSGLSKSEQRQVLSAAGATWQLDKIRGALKLMYADTHFEDKHRPYMRPKPPVKTAGGGKGPGKGEGKGESHRWYPSRSTPWQQRPKGSKGHGKPQWRRRW